jgi:hypothetical protein
MKRHLRKRHLVLLALLLSPLSFLTLLFGFNLINPMALMFLTSFTIENHSSEDIWVSPIGAVGAAGHRYTLPFSVSEFPYLTSPIDREFYIPPGSSRSFTYDWDDIQFSEILIMNKSGKFYVLGTGLHPTEGQYRRPQASVFMVPPLNELSRAEQIHTDALLVDKLHRMLILHGLAILGLLPPLLILKAIRMKQNAEQTAHRGAEVRAR